MHRSPQETAPVATPLPPSASAGPSIADVISDEPSDASNEAMRQFLTAMRSCNDGGGLVCVCERLAAVHLDAEGTVIFRTPTGDTRSGSAVVSGQRVPVPLGPTFDVVFEEGQMTACGVDAAP